MQFMRTLFDGISSSLDRQSYHKDKVVANRSSYEYKGEKTLDQPEGNRQRIELDNGAVIIHTVSNEIRLSCCWQLNQIQIQMGIGTGCCLVSSGVAVYQGSRSEKSSQSALLYGLAAASLITAFRTAYLFLQAQDKKEEWKDSVPEYQKLRQEAGKRNGFIAMHQKKLVGKIVSHSEIQHLFFKYSHHLLNRATNVGTEQDIQAVVHQFATHCPFRQKLIEQTFGQDSELWNRSTCPSYAIKRTQIEEVCQKSEKIINEFFNIHRIADSNVEQVNIQNRGLKQQKKIEQETLGKSIEEVVANENVLTSLVTTGVSTIGQGISRWHEAQADTANQQTIHRIYAQRNFQLAALLPHIQAILKEAENLPKRQSQL